MPTKVLTNGCFDLLHAGHVEFLAAAAKLGDRLIVAVDEDRRVRELKGPGRPIYGLAERIALLESLWFVEEVRPFERLETVIEQVVPDVYVKGLGTRKPVPGGHLVQRYGGRVVVLKNSRFPGRSTSLTIAQCQLQ